MFSPEEIADIKERYKNGFHVYFQPITGENNDVPCRTAEYLASGYFHNSMITRVDHERKTVTFRYKSWVDRKTKEKTYAEMTIDIYEPFGRLRASSWHECFFIFPINAGK